MMVHKDYSREAWSRRKRESTPEQRPRRHYQHGENSHGYMPPVRRVNYLFIFFGLSMATMAGLVLFMLYSFCIRWQDICPARNHLKMSPQALRNDMGRLEIHS